MLAEDTGQTTDVIARDVSLARHFDGEGARSYGLIDRIEK
jgi:ATP-dependent protease ClpP protease subunit